MRPGRLQRAFYALGVICLAYWLARGCAAGLEAAADVTCSREAR